MHTILNIVRFVGYSIGAVVIRKTWNWLTEDVDPVPGTKEFAREYRQTTIKYKRLRSKYESYIKNNERNAETSNSTH